MLRVTRLTDYGSVVLAHMARDPERVQTAAEIAGATRLSLPTASKLLKLLATGGLLQSFRGVRGGYALARPAEEISAADIVEAIEGPVAVTMCSHEAGLCDLESYCTVASNWQRINQDIRDALAGISLADLARPRGVPRTKVGAVTAAPASER